MKKLLPAVFLLVSLTASAQWDTLITNCNTYFKGIYFTSRDSGVAVGGEPTAGNADLRRTTDGGLTWTQPSFPQGLKTLNAVRFYGSQTGCAVGNDGGVLLTTDGGATWDSVPHFTTEDLLCVSYPTSTGIFAAGTNGALFKSLDGGMTWDTLNSESVLAIHDMHFIQAVAGFIVGDGGYIAATGDGGADFTPFGNPYFGFFQARGFAYVGSSTNGFCVGTDGRAIFTTDGGQTWTMDSIIGTSTYDLEQVRFLNDSAGLICGEGGLVYRTHDGGATWQNESYVGENLTDISFAGDSTAYICGANGRIIKTRRDISAVPTIAATNFSVNVFPNPCVSDVTIAIHVQQAETFTVTITDLTGRVVLQQQNELAPGEQLIRTDVSGIASGVYVMTVVNGSSAVSVPLIRQ